MGTLDDTAIFAAIVQQGGFSHAAKHLGLSNGLVSRRISQLETKLGVSLIKRTTRQLQLTQEGELFWQHAERIQQELNTAISLIQSSAKKPKGMIRISAPPYFGKQYLIPIMMKFLTDFGDIKIDLILTNQKLDPIKEQLDLVIRGVGYLDDPILKDSTIRTKLLIKEKINLYASPEYLLKHGEPSSPEDLSNHVIINYTDVKRHDKWTYTYRNKTSHVAIKPAFNCNDIEGSLIACTHGHGIGKFTELNAKNAMQAKLLQPILEAYRWGHYQLFAIYSDQQSLPKRTRLLLEFINAHTQSLLS